MAQPVWHGQDLLRHQIVANAALLYALGGNLRIGIGKQRRWRKVCDARLLVGLEGNRASPFLAAEREKLLGRIGQQCDIVQKVQIRLLPDCGIGARGR